MNDRKQNKVPPQSGSGSGSSTAPLRQGDPLAPATAPAKTGQQELPEWTVLVRHSPFLVKTLTVRAETREEARRLFLEAARQAAETKAGRQRGPERDKDAQRVRDSYQDAIRRQGELEWVIRPAADVEAERTAIKAAQAGAAAKYDATAQVLATAGAR